MPTLLLVKPIARVRVSSVGGLDVTGFASDGEVEDYRVSILERPEVVAVEINNDQAQRSNLTEIVVRFNSEVTAPSSAFQIKQRETDTVLDALVVSSAVEAAGTTATTLTFGDGGNLVVDRPNAQNSLVDGNYELLIDHTQVLRVGVDSTMAADFILGRDAADGFFRFFADQDGDRDADGTDLVAFGGTFRKNNDDPGFNPAFDQDGDDDVDTTDLIEFGQRFRSSLPFA